MPSPPSPRILLSPWTSRLPLSRHRKPRVLPVGVHPKRADPRSHLCRSLLVTPHPGNYVLIGRKKSIEEVVAYMRHTCDALSDHLPCGFIKPDSRKPLLELADQVCPEFRRWMIPPLKVGRRDRKSVV